MGALFLYNDSVSSGVPFWHSAALDLQGFISNGKKHNVFTNFINMRLNNLHFSFHLNLYEDFFSVRKTLCGGFYDFLSIIKSSGIKRAFVILKHKDKLILIIGRKKNSLSFWFLASFEVKRTANLKKQFCSFLAGINDKS